MRRVGLISFSLVMLSATWSWGNTYKVRTKNDSGEYTLRWAINEANTHPGADAIVFVATMSGKVIEPLTELPILTDSDTSIDGDIDGNGTPDVSLEGGSFSGSGLIVWGDRCTIRGLTVAMFDGAGIGFASCADCVVECCYIGWRSAFYAPNAIGIYLFQTTGCRVGGSTAKQRNVILGGIDAASVGILIENAQNNRVTGNYVGVEPDGLMPLPSLTPTAVSLRYTGAGTETTGNIVGGTKPGERNVLTNCQWGVVLEGVCNNRVLGNYIGFAADGVTYDEGTKLVCVLVARGSKNNQIGGTTAKARNYLAQGYGVICEDPGTVGNRIQGNYIGLNALGNAAGPIGQGVIIGAFAGSQTIGGATRAAGNWFGAGGNAVQIENCGSGTVIRHNQIGVLGNGKNAPNKLNCGALIMQLGGGALRASFLDNLVARCRYGLRVQGANVRAYAYRNRFRCCTRAVQADHAAWLFLGNLGNAATDDDGGNVFYKSNQWYIRNQTGRAVKAEGNDFIDTSHALIDPKIWDQLDTWSAGPVDINPLIGGVHPSGETEPAALAITATAAMPVGSGAEIVFTLCAPAEVSAEVVNIAGRPVATISGGGHVLSAGTQRLLWNARTNMDTLAPAGRYLVRITARSPGGQEASALCALNLVR
jgi:hypothetical protein